MKVKIIAPSSDEVSPPILSEAQMMPHVMPIYLAAVFRRLQDEEECSVLVTGRSNIGSDWPITGCVWGRRNTPTNAGASARKRVGHTHGKGNTNTTSIGRG
jgi:hypothetical protein